MRIVIMIVGIFISFITYAQPASDSVPIKQELTNRVTSLQTLLNANYPGLVNINIEDYQAGDKVSSAYLVLTFTGPVSKRVITNKIKLNITNGPEITVDNNKIKALAFISGVMQMSQVDPTPLLQFTSILDRNPADWKIDLIIPPQHIGPLISSDGAKAQLMLKYTNNNISATAFAIFLQKIAIDIPGRFQLAIAPFNYKSGMMQQDQGSMQVMEEINFSQTALTMNGVNAFSFNAGKFLMSSTMKDNVISVDRSVSLTGAQTQMLGDLKQLLNVNLHLQLKNIAEDPLANTAIINPVMSGDKAQDFIGKLQPNSEINLDTTIETNLGNFTCAIKLSLNAVPKSTGPELMNFIDANINLYISNKLLLNFINLANAFALQMPPSQSMSTSAQPARPDLMQEVNKLVQSGIIAQTNDGYTFSFVKQGQKMLLNGSDQNPFLQMLRMPPSTQVK